MADEIARDRLEVISFKHRASRKRMAEAIQAERGHTDLSVTMREALDQYIERYLREAHQRTAA